MFFPDKVAGYAETLRVLKPGGSFIFNVWDAIEANEFSQAATEAAASVFPDDPPQFLARTPHGYHDVDLIRDELAKAGFSQVSITTLGKTSTAASAHDAAYAYCQGTPLRNEIESRGATLLDQVTERAAEAIASRFGNATVSGKIRAYVVEAVV
jgi:SAM-dependent methyltransferase